MNTGQLKSHIFAQLQAAGVESVEARRESELIVEEVTGLTLSNQVLYSEPDLSAQALEKAEAILAQRRQRVPLQYCLGYAYFLGRKFFVEPGVFIPRPDTEHLVEHALKLLNDAKSIAEIGTGSGAIVVSLLKQLPALEAFAIDASDKAIEVTGKNAVNHGVSDRLLPLHGDWRSVLPHKLDAIVSNPPYIPRSQELLLAPEIRLHEPELALYGGDADGLGFYRQLSLEAATHMKPGGPVILEVGDGQAEDVARLFSNQGWLNIDMQKDIQGIARVVSAQSPLTGSQKEINC